MKLHFLHNLIAPRREFFLFFYFRFLSAIRLSRPVVLINVFNLPRTSQTRQVAESKHISFPLRAVAIKWSWVWRGRASGGSAPSSARVESSITPHRDLRLDFHWQFNREAYRFLMSFYHNSLTLFHWLVRLFVHDLT